MTFLSDYYLWLKSLHVLSLIAWMAALLYLPRLFVYHAERGAPGSELSETLKVMERKLLRGIANPSMIATWVFGILTVLSLGLDWFAQAAWLHAKLLFVLGITVMHMFCARWRRDFAEDRNTRSGRFYRVMNEVPAVALIFIVILAVVQPF